VSLAFVPKASSTSFTRRPPSSVLATVQDELIGSETIHKESYDIVKVDLDDGRDYPIYIGTGFDEKEGTCRRLVHTMLPLFISF